MGPLNTLVTSFSSEVGYCSICNHYNSISTGVCNCANKKLSPSQTSTVEDLSFGHSCSGDTAARLKPTPTTNNGGDTDYYSINPSWQTAQDIIEARQMNFAQGNIFKAAFTFNAGRHEATTYERELNKIAWFVNRELKRLHSTNSKDY